MAAWDRQPGESAPAYAAACIYFFELGAAQSLKAVAERVGKSVGLMERWSARWHWVERDTAHKTHLAAVAQAAREEAERSEAQRWGERRRQERESEWQAAQALLGKAQQMLAFPLALVTKRSEERQAADGKHITEVTEVHPAGWRWRDVATYFDTGAKLARLAAEMETARQTVQGPDGKSLMGPSVLISDDVLREALARITAWEEGHASDDRPTSPAAG